MPIEPCLFFAQVMTVFYIHEIAKDFKNQQTGSQFWEQNLMMQMNMKNVEQADCILVILTSGQEMMPVFL